MRFVPGRNCSACLHASGSGVLVDGAAYYRAFVDAARAATSRILIAGWQFDSRVRLLRGPDARNGAAANLELLDFLNDLCRAKPELQVYILAWDFSFVFALERQWMQRFHFDWRTDQRVHFRFDDTHAPGASHHEKLVVVDGELAFAGGIDLCSSRWDRSDHALENAERTSTLGLRYPPFHDVQAYARGDVARYLEEHFCRRWHVATGERLAFGAPRPVSVQIEPTQALSAGELAVSRTVGGDPSDALQEISALYEDAILSAESCIYIETQYLTARAINDALLRRLEDRSRPQLNLVVMLPRRGHSAKEEIALGAAQRRVIRSLRTMARANSHDLGIYNSVVGDGVATFIHSKLMIVDNRFVTIGSANLTNRSMALDTELNLAWLASPASELSLEIDELRAKLLVEHVRWGERSAYRRPGGLVKRLDRAAQSGRSRLEPVEDEPPETEEPSLLELACDPRPELLTTGNKDWGVEVDRPFFALGIALLENWFQTRRDAG